MSDLHQIRLLTLNAEENHETTLYRLEKGWRLRFLRGPSLLASNIRIFCNHPQDKESVFMRSSYSEVEWYCPTGMKSDCHDVYAEVRCLIAGSFNYYFTIDETDSAASANGQGYFLVDPTLRVGEDDDEITLDCIQCQTVLAKALGYFDDWEGRLTVAKATGYNVIHFSPIQELGQSNSAYSICDQLNLNHIFNKAGQNYSMNDVETLVKKMKTDWKVLSMTDLVLNHTADNSPWLQDHPECSYNLKNSPHLKPAYLVDRILYHFTQDISDGSLQHKNISNHIDSELQLTAMRRMLLDNIFPSHKFHEFYTVDVDKTLEQFKSAIEDNKTLPDSDETLDIIQDLQYRRLESTINLGVALKLYNVDRPGVRDEGERIQVCCDALRTCLEELNRGRMDEMSDHIHTAVDNVIANARYRFLASDGPKLGKISTRQPLMDNYFIQPASVGGSVEKDELLLEGASAQYIMASNGWVMGDNPLRNFADADSNVYLRRELISWGDSVKLRYGKEPQDCPYLWQRMTDYTVSTASIFHGVRLDNCHSTPIHVAEYMMDVARKINPDLYVVAELFTSSEHTDNLFINKLGINSLIREALSAWDAHEEGRLVHRFGGSPVGAFAQPRMVPLNPSMAHALFCDQTHDNPSPIQKRSVYDLLPSAALVAMACCATGSNRGYDELTPHHIHVVKEDRAYQSWSEGEVQRGYTGSSSGIVAGKRLLNLLHYEMGQTGFSQVYVDQFDTDVVSVTRHNPITHKSVVLVAHTSFKQPAAPLHTGTIKPLEVEGSVEEIIFEARLHHDGGNTYMKDPEYINGLPGYSLVLREHLQVSESDVAEMVESGSSSRTKLMLNSFPPGSVLVVRTSLPVPAQDAILQIRGGLSQFGYLMRSYSGRSLPGEAGSDFQSIVSRLNLTDLNIVLFRCGPEDSLEGGLGLYDVPDSGPMVYCGLQGIVSLLSVIRPGNDLGHPLCNNLREGDWLPNYVRDRLKRHQGTKELGLWFENVFRHLSNVPRYLIPCYFDAIISGAYIVLREQALELMSDFVIEGSSFVKGLAMGAVQFCSPVVAARLPALSPNLTAPKPPRINDVEVCPSLAAGFPHFSNGYMRNWGRDTFISLRGLLLLPGRHQEARYLILAYGGCLRHGLIPNLLNRGVGARYNCRDAIWWWLQAIQDYCLIVSDGTNILQDMVSRLYPTDNSEPLPPGAHEQPLCDVIQEGLQRHADGIEYRERNAGADIDSVMKTDGFNVKCGVRWDTGFVYGGNEFNCGTWMDKNGTSKMAGNQGKPATPRDGSAVELIALCKSSVRWLHSLHEQKLYPYDGVTAADGGTNNKISFIEWGNNLKANFERYFWVPTAPFPGELTPELVVRRGIYKDSYKATQFWADYQLRPNYPIAMVLAPELFTPENAWHALGIAETVLMGPLGMKTLDPSDWGYVPVYDQMESDNPNESGGFGYHQGPEWVWPTGPFLRAKLHFAKILDSKQPGLLRETVNFVKSRLTKHYQALIRSPWQSLPELTNNDGNPCRYSCQAQAWSVGCILEVLYDLEQLAAVQTL